MPKGITKNIRLWRDDRGSGSRRARTALSKFAAPALRAMMTMAMSPAVTTIIVPLPVTPVVTQDDGEKCPYYNPVHDFTPYVITFVFNSLYYRMAHVPSGEIPRDSRI
jgi:hypothetical protein